ncbi:NAD(P)-binding domain-containing protein [Vibrio sp. SS-MA-C1-2]|uniref:NAD(P)-binding domain-containing protein n=1 Tax=Vibrio sp. SS-MA-C1-2 TaxID=2908646 RepID=UPI001F4061E6|nr:NAD(P)-binding domain-containing protein [Vibrio sp. SS-MA-C1-2]UJF17860.1 NAD(P)-binding domain-containing protein [Vibrio sp. SS-MA-C1-2]
MATLNRVALIGFDDTAKSFMNNWQQSLPKVISAYDIKTECPSTREAILLQYIEYGVQGTFVLEEALSSAQLIFSFVPNLQAIDIAKDCAQYIHKKQLYLDCSSTSMVVKKQAAHYFERTGLSYIDVAVMPKKTANKKPLSFLFLVKKQNK